MTVFSLLILILAALVVGLVVWTKVIGKNVETLAPRLGELTKVNGGTLHYLDIGPRDGQVLVLIHGLSGQMQHFTHTLSDRLARDYRVILVDRPGCGYSERDSDDLASFQEQGRMIGELLDQLGIDSPVLVGHSLGGAISLAMGLDRPNKTAGVALLCPLTHPEPAPSPAFQGLAVKSPLLRRLIGHTIAVPMAKRTAATVIEIVFRPEPCPDDFMTAAGGALGLRPKAFVTASADFVASDASTGRLAERCASEWVLPGGVLFGADDNILPPDRHGAPMTNFGLTYETIPGAGHMIPLTQPDACETFIRTIASRCVQGEDTPVS